MKKYSNMAEFAAELNLSRSTVSYILNDKWSERNISPETVRRVKEYAAKVNFVPNFFGRAIKGKIHSEAAVLLPSNAYHHHQEAFFRLLNNLDGSNVKYMVLPVSKRAGVSTVLEQLVAYNVDRVLMISSPLLKSIDDVKIWQKIILSTPNIQWLLYDCPDSLLCGDLLQCSNVGFVGFERNSAMQLVFSHVKNKGYEKLLYYGFSQDYFNNSILPTQAIFAPNDTPVNTSTNLGEVIATALLEKFPPKGVPQAVFINDDLLTVYVISALQKMNLSVPKDYAFISWDGLVVSQFFQKRLTTLEIPHDKMVLCALDFLTGKSKLPRVRFDFQIREGETMPSLG